MALPPDEQAERNATVCMPCPKCGNIIKSFKVHPTSLQGDTTVLSALCEECQWSDEAAVLTDDLGHTSLALPEPVFAPGESILDQPIFPSRPPQPAPVKSTRRPSPSESADEAADEMLCMSAESPMLEDVAGVPMMDAAVPLEQVVRRHSTSTLRKLRVKRRRWEAWVLTIACFVALAMGGLELIFLAHRMTTPQIVLVAVFLLPVLVFLVDGLKGLWRDTIPA